MHVQILWRITVILCIYYVMWCHAVTASQVETDDHHEQTEQITQGIESGAQQEISLNQNRSRWKLKHNSFI